MHPFLDKYFQFIKRVVPSSRQGSFVGLDIASGACRAVEITWRKTGFEILRWKVEPIEGQEEKAALARIIAAWDLRAKPRPIISAVSGRGTLVRYIDMPRMTIKELRQAFIIEADKYFPFPKDTIRSDCFILDPNGQDKKMAVLIAAVKRDIVEARIKLFKESGLDIETLTVTPIAIANAFAVSSAAVTDAAGQATAIVDIGGSATGLMIMVNRVPHFNRDIFIGTGEFVKRLGNIAGVPLADAGKMLQQPAGKEEIVRQAVETVMANLVAEIRLSFDYFNTEKNLQVTRVVILGEGALIPGIPKALQDSLGIPVVSWDPCDKLLFAKDARGEDMRRQGPQMAAALGLAMNGYD
ncbi:MAG: type IV pilus assembly protein PilM [Candidatus Omnitrophica bacterium]|nr:type IV pilus assembly protein PilM [Candidatus Omnitrophota bacterium]